MITSLDEINQVKKLINEAKTELDKQKKIIQINMNWES